MAGAFDDHPNYRKVPQCCGASDWTYQPHMDAIECDHCGGTIDAFTLQTEHRLVYVNGEGFKPAP